MSRLLAVAMRCDFPVPEMNEKTVGSIAIVVIVSNWSMIIGSLIVTLLRH